MSDKQSRWGRRRVVAGIVGAGLAAATLSVVAPAGVAEAETFTYTTVLTKGHSIAAGHTVSSATVKQGPNGSLDHHYELSMQTNGNLVERVVYPAQQSSSVFWQTGTTNLGAGGHFSLTSDGDLVVTDAKGTWKAGTPGNAATHLAIADNGNIVLRTASNTAVWASRNGLCAKVPITNGKISSEVSTACRQLGKHYAWGGGHASVPGPSRGSVDPGDPGDSAHDPDYVSFDCSGLTRYAYYRATGHDVPGGSGATTAAAQWDHKMTGTQHQTSSTSGLTVGDFVYFKTGSDLHHTAIWLGNGYIVEAPYSGAYIRVAPMSEHGDFYGYIHVWQNY